MDDDRLKTATVREDIAHRDLAGTLGFIEIIHARHRLADHAAL